MVGVINDPGFAGRLGATVSGLPQTTTRIPVQRGSYGGYGGYIGGGRGGSSGGGRGGSGRTNTVIVPWGVPVMYGGGVGYGYDYSMAPAPTQTIVQPVVQPAPSVVINQYYTPETGSRAEMREYSDLPQPIRPPRMEVEESDGRVTVVPAPRQPAAAAPSDPTGRASLQAATTPTITLLRLKDTGSIAEVIAYWRQGESLHYITSDYQKVVLPLEALDRDATAQLNRDRNVEFRIEEIR
jgi:hypothetical protein